MRDAPVFLSFYRGEWCPYCNLALHTSQQRIDDLTSAGGQFVAVSPQRPTDALSLAEKHQLAFPVLSDETQDVIRAYRLQFDLPPALKDLYADAWGLDLTEQTADGSWSLPVPGTFVVDRNRRIRFAPRPPTTGPGPNRTMSWPRSARCDIRSVISPDLGVRWFQVDTAAWAEVATPRRPIAEPTTSAGQASNETAHSRRVAARRRPAANSPVAISPRRGA